MTTQLAPPDWPRWERIIVTFLAETAQGDAAHDGAHIRRVVANACALAAVERADLEVVLPAAWLHDCVTIPKDSPLRGSASVRAAEIASAFLREQGYPAALIPSIEHAIAAHSFSAGIAPETLEAQVVQDADRLDSLGAVGIARCLMLGGAMGKPLYHTDDPFAATREPDDAIYTLDHFFRKLLKLAGMMQTDAGRSEAERRTAYMRGYLAQLGHEIGSVKC